MKGVLVTGATGFIGRRLCADLIEQGFRVTGAARRGVPGPWHEFVPLDVTRTSAHAWPLEEGMVVVHAAGLAHDVSGRTFDGSDYAETNTLGAVVAAEAVRHHGCAGMVLLSSIKAMGDDTGDEPQDEGALCRPTSPYGRAKREAELGAAEVLGEGAPLSVLRLTPVYGPGSKGNLNRLTQLAERRWMPPLPVGRGRRSMVDVRDVAELCIELATTPKRLTMIVEDGHSYTPREIQDWVRATRGVRSTHATIPAMAVRLAGAAGSIAQAVTRRPAPFSRTDARRLLRPAVYRSRELHRVTWRPSSSLYDALGLELEAGP